MSSSFLVCALVSIAPGVGHGQPAPPATPPPTAPPDTPPPGEPPATAAPTGDAGTVRGVVTAERGGAPIAGASVSIEGINALVFSDEHGQYTLSAPPGTYTLRVEAPGSFAREVAVTVGEAPAEVDVQLAEDQRGEVITIIGSRTPRSRLETPVPVDIINADAITESSETELNQILNTLAPSFNATHLSIADGTDHIDPADLRGLGPEHVLVLVNGKRLHQSSIINVYNGGTVGVDLNAIPTAAIARIEVLRDGAASQYGSDAIAGVINIVLKDTVDTVDAYTLLGTTASGDGTQFKLGANTGMALGRNGFVNVTGEFFARGRTNRSGAWTSDIFPGVEGTAETDAVLAARGLSRDDFKMHVGNAGALVGTGVLNAGYRLDRAFELHAQGNYTLRKGYASGFYRFPNSEDQVDLRLYPNGFLPEINPLLNAWNGTVGVRGKGGPWEGDLSVTYGGDSFHFYVDHSLNASLGQMSPTHFDAGKLHLHQTSLNFDGVRRIELKGLSSLSLVGGAELRRETYGITAGQPESYELGPELDSAGEPKLPGSQVFPGFRPSDASDKSRLSEAVYAGVETQPTKNTNVDLGGRYEHYSDFGNTLTGKLAVRAGLLRTDDADVALRGSASTGFRAPGLQQLWYSTIATQFANDQMTGMPTPTNILISPNRSEVTEAFGVPHLKEETSVNFSAGLTARLFSNLSLSADYYHVEIKDRVILTALFDTGDAVLGDAISAIVAPFAGVAATQFFVNSVNTTTNGVDVVLDYSYRLPNGQLKLTAAANLTATSVDKVNVPQSMLDKFASIPGGADRVSQVFLGRYGRNRLEDLQPRQKATLGLHWDFGPLSLGLRGNFFGPTKYHSDTQVDGAFLDESFGAKATLDVDLSYRMGKMMWSVGGNNVFDTFPDEVKQPDNRYFESFLYSPAANTAGAPYGVDGAFFYVRAQYRY